MQHDHKASHDRLVLVHPRRRVGLGAALAALRCNVSVLAPPRSFAFVPLSLLTFFFLLLFFFATILDCFFLFPLTTVVRGDSVKSGSGAVGSEAPQL